MLEQRKQRRASVRAEIDELLVAKVAEEAREQEAMEDRVKQLKALHHVHRQDPKVFNPTESAGLGLLDEMSLVEMHERHAINKARQSRRSSSSSSSSSPSPSPSPPPSLSPPPPPPSSPSPSSPSPPPSLSPSPSPSSSAPSVELGFKETTRAQQKVRFALALAHRAGGIDHDRFDSTPHRS